MSQMEEEMRRQEALKKAAWAGAWARRGEGEAQLDGPPTTRLPQAPFAQAQTLGHWGWLRRAPPPRRSLLTYRGGCMLPRGKVGFFIGEGGVGKSWALCQMAVAVAAGVPWLETFEVPQDAKGAVLLVMAEEDGEELHRRLFELAHTLALSAGQLADLEAHIWPMALAGHAVEFLQDGAESAAHHAFEQLLTAHAPAGGWRLIALDPASRFMGVDAEKDNAYATRFVQLLERLTLLPGQPAVVCVHHTSKSSRQPGQSVRAGAARGASALTDGARWQGNIAPVYDPGQGEPVEGRAIFQVTKSNYGPIPGPVYLERQPGGGVLRRIEGPEDAGGGAKAAPRWSRLGKGEQEQWHNFSGDLT